MIKIGKKLKEIRNRHDMSQEELSKLLNVDRTIISKWENDCLLPSIENLQMMATIYDLTIDEIINNKYMKKSYFTKVIHILKIFLLVSLIIVMCKIVTCFF